MTKAFYFGCWDRPGHFLHGQDGRTMPPKDLPWHEGLMDSGLLKNRGVPDVPDGRVHWTCGGRSLDDLWFAFVWWDRSVDKRGACNSGFYVHGFKKGEAEQAFAFARATFPKVVERQAFPLQLVA